MPRWLHRSTRKMLDSVASADLPEPVENYIEDPDLSAVGSAPPHHWQITGDVITLLDQAGRDSADATVSDARLDSVADGIEVSGTLLRAFAEVLLVEINTLRAEHSMAPRTLSQIRDAIRGRL